MIDIRVPSVGESVSSGILAVWLKKDGEFVQEGDELFELETDKATMAIPSPATGVLHVSIAEGKEVDIDSVVGQVDETASADAASPSKKESKAPEESSGKQGPAADASAPPQPPASVGESALAQLSPAVRKLVVEKGIDPAKIQGSGPGGRILKEDVSAFLDGSKSAVAAPTAGPAQGAMEAASPEPAVKSAGGREQRRIAMTPIRKKIAERLVASKQGAAHLTTFNEVDMTEVMALRNRYKEAFEKKFGVKLGFMSFFIKAAQRALLEIPEVNAFVDGTDIVYNDYVDIGVAMSTDRGLITPVIRNVETLGFAEIEATILDFGQRAKNKRIMPNDLIGGTFTVSNGGVFGSMLSTPIPNPPQTAVLGMHSIQERPMVVGGQIVARPMMYLALTYDHRMLDGKDAIGFLKKIKDQLEDPARMVLDL